MMVLYFILSAVLMMAGVDAHGRLQVPTTRKGAVSGPGAYENDPVNFGVNVPATTYPGFVCRNDPPRDGNSQLLAPQTQVTAGSQMDVKWLLSAQHVGDCAMYVSYDYDKAGADGLSSMRWFKIANWKDCKSLSSQVHQITLPSWLPAGRAVFRWDWYALHVWPAMEFYAQCSDVQISNPSVDALTIADVQSISYSIMGLYPEEGDAQPIGWRRELGVANPVKWITGPPCACRLSTANGCEFTADSSATQGFIATPSIDNQFGCGSSLVGPSPSQPVATPIQAPTEASIPVLAPVESPTEAPAPCTNPENPWAKCGGNSYSGSGCCTSGHHCEFQSVWFSQCVPSGAANVSPVVPVSAPSNPPVTPAAVPTPPPSDPSVEPGCVALWGRCGGLIAPGQAYSGPTCCVEGSCQRQNEWWSQCRTGPCPAGWSC